MGVHNVMISENETRDHDAFVFGLRELDDGEAIGHCSSSLSSSATMPVRDERVMFSGDYWIRTFISGCYYLDSNEQWQSDGLRVSAKL
jgi:hypothetical protein